MKKGCHTCTNKRHCFWLASIPLDTEDYRRILNGKPALLPEWQQPKFKWERVVGCECSDYNVTNPRYPHWWNVKEGLAVENGWMEIERKEEE